MEDASTIGNPARPLRILYMEDDAGLARLIQKKLPKEQYQMDRAADGAQGIAMFEAAVYDVLLVDHYMPVYNGLEVIRTLATKSDLPPTIVITGAGDEKLAVEAMKLGASDYVIKDADGDYVDLIHSVIQRALVARRHLEEKIRSEKALQEREELLRLITDSLPVCISYMDAQERYLFANRTHEEWFGMPIQDMIGRHFADLWGQSAGQTARKHLASVFEGETVHYQEQLTLPDGSTHYLSATHVPHVGQDGSVKGYVSLISDITGQKRIEQELREVRDELERRVVQRTAQLGASNEKLRVEIQERKRAEKELQASEELFRTIFDSALDGIFVKDREMRYTKVNPAMERLLGLPGTDIVGRTSRDLFDQEAARQVEETDRRVLDGHTVEQLNTRRVKNDLITFHDIRVPLRDNTGTIIGLCGITRDITGLKRPEPEALFEHEAFPSQAMKRTLTQALRAAQSDTTVLLLGESGSGKDFLARYIHDHSHRSGGPFFTVNCAAVAGELAEPELFGHEAGAFTGAQRRKRGLLELAEGGTLLLNEIGDLPLSQQAKLLTFLDTRSLTRVGGETSFRVNTRIIAATNCDLHKEVTAGRFRLDLFYRLNVLSITVPPLRERPEDLPLLVRRIVSKLATEMQLHKVPHVDAFSMRALAQYHWPGNVRQLRNLIERALILSRGEGHSVFIDPLRPSEPAQGQWTYSVNYPQGRSVNDVLDEVKRALITETLVRSKGNRQVAAQMLGISRFALFRMMKALDIGEQP